MTKLPVSGTDSEGRESEQTAGHLPPCMAIRGAVIASLGRPPGLFRVAVMPLWRDYYRVNVLTGPDATSICIPHSYFVEARDDGAIISASPPIVRLYP
jgi:hypothetical protein